jgi:hypothetical protein
MYFALMIRTDPEVADGQSPEDFMAVAAAVDTFDTHLTEGGQNLGSLRLGATNDARVIRLRAGKPFTTDGPFAESREQIGGIYLVEADDLQAATGLAERLATSRIGSIEVRPVRGIDLRRVVLDPPDTV